jgi:hypothetical protein
MIQKSSDRHSGSPFGVNSVSATHGELLKIRHEPKCLQRALLAADHASVRNGRDGSCVTSVAGPNGSAQLYKR